MLGKRKLAIYANTLLWNLLPAREMSPLQNIAPVPRKVAGLIRSRSEDASLTNKLMNVNESRNGNAHMINVTSLQPARNRKMNAASANRSS